MRGSQAVEDRALHQLFRRHQRLLGEFLRAFHGNQECELLREELVVVDEAIWEELGRRGHSKESNITIQMSYDDPNSIFVLTYVQLDEQFRIKT